MFKNKRTLIALVTVTCIFVTTWSKAASQSIDQELISLSQDTQAIQAGKGLYEGICASCHGKDLTGAMGFNLVDGEWIHGSSPSAILGNIENGFSKGGMPAFKGIFSPQQLKQITAFVISQRQGWLNLEYKVYPIDESSQEVSFVPKSGQRSVKSGTLPTNLADFSLPENQHYLVTFEGEFNAPWNEPVNIWIKGPAGINMQVLVDGINMPRNTKIWQPTFPLKQGKQRLKISYTTVGTPKWVNKDLILLVANEDVSIKLTGISSKGHAFLKNSKYLVEVADEAKVIRRKVVALPPYSISVGMPNNMNFAFNSKSCSIVGMWKGDFLNIGPNIDGRGQDGGIPLGDWVFKPPQSIKLEGSKPCKYIKYTRKGNPTFYFEQDGHTYAVSGQPHGQDVKFIFKTESQNAQPNFSLPSGDKLTVSSDSGPISQGKLKVGTSTSQVNINVSVSE